MFGADLAYMDSCIDQEFGTSTDASLPEYLYPTFRVPNPWHRHTHKTQLECDIVVIAEFSELEGPKPVITIPNDRDIHFNINDFTVRIMSVDQGSSGQPGFNMPEDSQVMMSDTKENVYAFVHHFVLLDKHARGYSRPFAISYVTADQRKLLNFSEEISSSFKKVVRFLKYGNKLVFKNDLDKFMIDLQYTKDQMVNRFRSTVQPGQTDSDNKLLQSLKILESHISEILGILSKLNPTLNDKRLEQRFAKIEEKAQVNKGKPKSDSFSLQDWESIETPDTCSLNFASLGSIAESDNMLFFDAQHYKPKLVEIIKDRKFDLHLRGLHELCYWGAKEGLQKLRCVYKYFQQDIAVLEMQKKDLSLIDPPAGLVTFGNKFLGANFMANVDKICISTCCFMRVPGTRSNVDTWNLLGRSWSSNETLSSFKSIQSSFQSFPDDDDDDDTDSMLSANSDLGFYIQRKNSLGSFQLIGSFDSCRVADTPPDFFVNSNRSSLQDDNYMYAASSLESTLSANQKLDFTHSDLNNEEAGSKEKSRDNEYNVSKLKEKVVTSLENSSTMCNKGTDSAIDENHKESSNIPSDNNCDLDNELEGSDERERSRTIVNEGASQTIQNVCDKNNESFQNILETPYEDSLLSPNSQETAFKENKYLSNIVNDFTNNDNLKCLSDGDNKLSPPTLAIENLGNMITKGCITQCSDCSLVDIDSSSGVSSYGDCMSKLSENSHTENGSFGQNTDINNQEFKTDSEQCNKTSIFRFNTCSDTLPAGSGIIKVLQTYSNIQNVIYSLLIGQTVVVIGSAAYEEEIKSLVIALKVFLPGCHRHSRAFVLWSGKGITLTDLADIKLIGICRHEKKSVERMTSKSVQKYITLFDVERKTITSPTYQGGLITTIISRKRSFKTEESYINFIKVLLCDFSSKAFIFFHSFCLGSVGTVVSNSPTVLHQSNLTKKNTSAFLSKLGVQDCDVQIIEYLTELVKYQHIEDHYKTINPQGVPQRPVMRNSCQQFKC